MIKRESYLKKVTAFKDDDLIKILVGIRRSGKSSILAEVEKILLKEKIPRNNIIKINFESLDYLDINSKADFLTLATRFNVSKVGTKS